MDCTNIIKKLLGKGQYTFYNSLIEKVTFFVLFVYLARDLNKGLYGNVILVFTFSSIIYSLFEFGLNSYFQREVKSSGDKSGRKIDQAIYIRLVSFVFYLLINFAYIVPKINISLFSFLLIIISIFIINTNSLFSSIFNGLSKYILPFKSIFISRTIFVVLFSIAVFLKSSLEILITALLISSICQSYINLKFLNANKISLFRNLFDLELTKTILKSSLPMGIGVLFVWLYNKADIIFIQHLIGYREVAIYAVSYSVYQLSAFFPGIVLTPLFTELSLDYSKNNSISFKSVYSSVFLLFGISVLICAIIYLTGDKIIVMVYGPEYSISSRILVLLIIAIPGLYLNNVTGVILNSIKKERLAMISAFFAFAINSIINIIYLPKIGIMAAVISTIITEYFIFIMQLVLILLVNKKDGKLFY
ncbi:MAG: oligosaccharide flippase family protein [Ignavibacteriaceae bacterium]